MKQISGKMASGGGGKPGCGGCGLLGPGPSPPKEKPRGFCAAEDALDAFSEANLGATGGQSG